MYWGKKTDSGPGEDGALQGVGGGSRTPPGCALVGSFHRTNWEWFNGTVSLLDF